MSKAAPPLIEEVSTITAKGQTTVPKSVRKALGVDLGGRIAFRLTKGGVSVHRVAGVESDPAIDSFLAFLAKDIKARPQAISAIAPDLLAHIDELTAGMDADPDAPIEGTVEI